MTTPFPTFEDVPDKDNPGDAPQADAAYLNSVNNAINVLEGTRLTQDDGDNRYILASNADGFLPADTGLADLADVTTTGAAVDSLLAVGPDTASYRLRTPAQVRTALGLSTTTEADARYAPQSLATGAFGGILAQLEAGESAAIQVISDSTGNETTEWVYLTTQWFAARFPNLRVLYKLWSDATQAYAPWTVVQAGASGERHALFAGNSRTMYLPAGNIPAITGDIDIRAKANLVDWSPAATQAIGARYGSAGARGWILQVNSTGRLQLSWSPDGTATVQVASTNPLAFADGTDGWVRATLDVDNGAGGYTCTLYTSTDGATWTQVGQSVTAAGATSIFNPTAQEYELGGRGFVGEPLNGKIYEFQIRNGIDGPIVNPQPIESWLPRSLSGGTPAPTFGGTPTLYVVNGANSGSGIAYFGDTTRLPKVVQPYVGSLVFVSSSHNEDPDVGVAFYAKLDTFLGQLKTRVPGASFCWLTQNPQVSPRTVDRIQPSNQRRRDMLTWAPRNGVYVIDTFKAFLDDSRGATALIQADGLHPNADGSQVWASAVQGAFLARR